MGKILEQFPEILKYGGTGLSAIVCFLTFWLLKEQSAKQRPNNSMIKAIKGFMGIAVILSIPSLVDVCLRSNNNNSEQLLPPVSEDTDQDELPDAVETNTA